MQNLSAGIGDAEYMTMHRRYSRRMLMKLRVLLTAARTGQIIS